MNVTVLDRKPEQQRETPAQAYLGFVDCDVHPFFRTPDEFDAFLSPRWREHRKSFGNRGRQGLSKATTYPRMSPGVGMRMDAWPKDGGRPVLTSA